MTFKNYYQNNLLTEVFRFVSAACRRREWLSTRGAVRLQAPCAGAVQCVAAWLTRKFAIRARKSHFLLNIEQNRLIQWQCKRAWHLHQPVLHLFLL
jgi:hypothetical protein